MDHEGAVEQGNMSSPTQDEQASRAGDGELESLREQVRQLALEKTQLQQQIAGAAAPDDADSLILGTVAPSTHTVTRYVQLARERRCPLFSGEPGEDTLPIDKWIVEVRRCWEGRELTAAEQVVFIHDHLTGNAKAEVEFHPEAGRETPAQVFELLREHFRSSRSYVHTLAQFFQRRQTATESVREFSYGLKRLMDTVSRTGAGHNADELLRGQLVEHVRDPDLRRMLDQRLSDDPALTFPAVRALAVKWDEAQPPRERARPQPRPAPEPAPVAASHKVWATAPDLGATPAPTAPPPPPAAGAPPLEDLTRLLARLIDQLGPARPTRAAGRDPRSSQTPNLGVVCFRCGAPGHIARFCPQPPVTGPNSRPPPRPPAGNPERAPVQAVEASAPEPENCHPLPSPASGRGEQ